MRSVVAVGAVATLLMGPSASAEVPRDRHAGIRPVTGDTIPDAWKKRTSLLVLPQRPRQNNVVRVFAHCPPAANHAIIGSTAFTLKGSSRLYREVGLGLSDRGLGRRSVSISYYAFLGHHEVLMKCVKVTINQKTRLRKVKVISRYAVPLKIRKFRISQFFD
ncbi:hypothetical protein [Nonomuraea lactucae]|uniref:hypothetical protein n=1 Tax=Nonomuraea lactucae TaxID=2249762 RepID=UPI0013B43C74|nr:hypothetical protein [Nonomuraea lactucae]